jgi:subtilisin family serine protease
MNRTFVTNSYSRLNIKHPGFRGSEVSFGKSFIRGATPGEADTHGHGTMCAGVVAGNKHGLAPKAKTVGVKISNDQNRAPCDSVVAGIEWVLAQPGSNNMKVINMSQYGFTGLPDVSTAVQAAIRKGLHFVTCSGNWDLDACRIQPTTAQGVISVGSIDGQMKLPTKQTDREGSNRGKCVTIFSAGSRVPTLSTHNLSETYQYFGWGTSFAAPQVAAIMANRLSAVGPQTPAQIKMWLVQTATKGQMQGELYGSPNLIAYSGVGKEILEPVKAE